MLSSARRTFLFLLHTPLLPPPPQPAAYELATISSYAGPSCPRAATRSFSGLSTHSVHAPALYSNSDDVAVPGDRRGMASDHGKKELYSDEGGSTGAGVSYSDL
jgi:hypothetical protein